jgi:hypothetical protein
MGLLLDVTQRGSPPDRWEARVQEIPVDEPAVVAVFRYVRRGKNVVLTEVAIRAPGDQPLVAANLHRRYPLASWEKAARASVIELWRESMGEIVPRHPFESTDPREQRSVDRLNRYAGIAAEYRHNVKKGLRDPVGEIAREHGVKPSTARGWVYRSRRLGLLGQARGRTSGEA